jgi:hypothetical protein
VCIGCRQRAESETSRGCRHPGRVLIPREHYLNPVTMTRESGSRPNLVTVTRGQPPNAEIGPCRRLGVTILLGLFQAPQDEGMHRSTVASNETTLDAIKTQENGNKIALHLDLLVHGVEQRASEYCPGLRDLCRTTPSHDKRHSEVLQASKALYGLNQAPRI